MFCVPASTVAAGFFPMADNLSYAKFEVAFWHPFGPHGGEEPKEIIER